MTGESIVKIFYFLETPNQQIQVIGPPHPIANCLLMTAVCIACAVSKARRHAGASLLQRRDLDQGTSAELQLWGCLATMSMIA